MKKISKKRLIVCIIGAILLIVGVVSTIFAIINQNRLISLDDFLIGDYELIDLSGEEYERLLSEKKSFIVLVDQTGCITARELKKFFQEIGTEQHIKIYRIMFSDARETSMHEYIKYYPSVVLVNQGTVQAWLKADADEDKDRYNNIESLKLWLNENIKWN